MAKELRFYDMKKKKKFRSSKYELKSKKTSTGMRYFAVAKAPSGIDSWRIISKETYQKLKK